MGEECRYKSVNDNKEGEEDGGRKEDSSWLCLSLTTHHDDDVTLQCDGGSPVETGTSKPSSSSNASSSEVVLSMEEEDQMSQSSFFVPLPVLPMNSHQSEVSNLLPQSPSTPAVDVSSATDKILFNPRHNRPPPPPAVDVSSVTGKILFNPRHNRPPPPPAVDVSSATGKILFNPRHNRPPPPPAVNVSSPTGQILFNQRHNRRSNPRQRPKKGKDLTIKPPYPWSTNTRAGIHTMEYLKSKNIDTITGEVYCRNCQHATTLDYDLKAKFLEISTFVFANIGKMFLRAPPEWSDPKLPTCTKCGTDNSMVPVISQKKRSINWLFLFVTNTVGHCGIKQLKYFCKHNKAHRTGAKDRVLYSTYMSICKQLDPTEPRFANL